MSIAVDAPTTLGRDGLTWDQQRHFAEHGWLLLEQVIDPDLCRAGREASERMMANMTCGRSPYESDRGHTTAFREAHLHDPIFFELYKNPSLLAAARQLVGHDKIRYIQSLTIITDPDHERDTRAAELSDPRRWGWHRSFRPRDLIRPHDTDPELVNTLMVGIGMYFVPIAPEHGVTAMMDGSHVYEGKWRESDIYGAVGDQFEIVQTAGIGSIIMFSEATLHSPAPVLSDQRRFAHLAFMAVPWFNRFGQEPYLHAHLADEGLRDLFAPCVTLDPSIEPE